MRAATDPSAGAAAATSAAGAVVEDAARQASPWITRGARLGYAAKGIVYVTLGLVALQAAVGSGQTQDQRGALRTIAQQPAGRVLLAIITVGLLSYTVWRLIAAVLDTEYRGSGAKGLALRAGMVARGLLYGGLGIEAWRLTRTGGSGRTASASGAGGDRTMHWTARAMSMPAGRWLVVGAGLGVLAYGLYQLYRSWKNDVRKHLDLADVSAATQQWIVRLGRFGIGARGVVFLVIGTFLLRAAASHDPTEASGIGGALQALEQGPWGPWVLGLVALGLVAYGLFQIVQARYRVVRAA